MPASPPQALHVLVVSPHLPPDHLGGVEVYSQYLLRALAARGHRVQGVAVTQVASGRVEACTAREDDVDGYPTHRLTVTLPASRPFALLSQHAPAETWFQQLLSDTRPDVVHVQSGYLLGAPALAAARRSGTPAVLTLHDYWFACPRVTLRHPDGSICTGAERPAKCAWCLTADQRRHGLLDRVTGGALTRGKDRSTIWRLGMGGPEAAIVERQAVLRDLLNSAAAVLAPTRFVAAQVAAVGYPVDRIRLSRYGMPPQRPSPPARTASLRLAFIGQLAPHKGVHVLIEAMRALAGRKVSLAVHGPLTPHPAYVAQLKALADDDTRITFHGPYRRESLADIFAATDVVVVPSIWHEVAAIVIQEAQMAGVPVLASSLGGSPELIADDRDGLLFDPARPGDLARQITRLLDEPGLLPRLVAAAPRPRTIDDEVDALLELYRAVGRTA
jgi:glycosyltransferase involved in cell wall biosynthesis